jgi:hypothetical protein
MSIEGYVGTHIVPGSVDGDEFFEFIVEDVVCPPKCPHSILVHLLVLATSNECFSK